MQSDVTDEVIRRYREPFPFLQEDDPAKMAQFLVEWIRENRLQ